MLEDRDLERDDLPFPLNRPITGQDLLGGLFPRLLRPLWRAAAQAVRADVGTVTQTLAGPPKRVVVTFSGDDTDTFRYLARYTPAVGDVVVVIRNRAQGIVLDKLA
jgi:hypothetical protein